MVVLGIIIQSLMSCHFVVWAADSNAPALMLPACRNRVVLVMFSLPKTDVRFPFELCGMLLADMDVRQQPDCSC